MKHPTKNSGPVGQRGGSARPFRVSGRFSPGFPAISSEVSENVSPCHVFGRFSPAPALISRHFARGRADTNRPIVGDDLRGVPARRGTPRSAFLARKLLRFTIHLVARKTT